MQSNAMFNLNEGSEIGPMDNDDGPDAFQGGDPAPFEPEADPYELNDDAGEN